MPLEIVITLPTGETERYPLPADVGVIGRSRACTISVKDPSVSAKHAIIENAPDGVFILDLGSTNGVRLSGRRIVRERLEPGRVFQLGRILLEVRSAAGIDENSPFADDLTQRPPPPAAQSTSSLTRLARIRATTAAALKDAPVGIVSPRPLLVGVSGERLAAIRSRAEEILKSQPGLWQRTIAYLKRTPWWALSLAAHVLVFIGLGLVTSTAEPSLSPLTVTLRIPSPEPLPLHLAEQPNLVENIIEEEATPIESPFLDESEEELLESDDDDVFTNWKGDSLDFLTMDSPGGLRFNESIGAGSGLAGGAFGGRVGGNRMRLVTRGGGSARTQAAVMAGLKWLAKHQLPEGNWGDYGPNMPCKDASCGTFVSSAHIGCTGLALLAFLGSGFVPGCKQTYEDISFGKVVANGLAWLMKQQTESGAFGSDSVSMYEQAIGTMALVEASAMCRRPVYSNAAARALRFLLEAQNPYAAWRYSRRSGDNDISVTGWCVMALRSAMLADFNVGKTTFEWAKSFVDSVTEKHAYGKIRIGYTRTKRGIEYVTPNGANAIGLLMKLYLEDSPATGEMNSLADALLTDLPDASRRAYQEGRIDYCYWYYATLGLFLYDGPDSGRPGKYWKEWNSRLIEVLTTSQNKKDEGCCYGSWDPIDRWSDAGGRVYSTALNTLTLEVYYRYPTVFTGAIKKKKQ